MRNDLNQIASRLLQLDADIAPLAAESDLLKDQLRAEAIERGEGFLEIVKGVGSVLIKAGCERKLKGYKLVLNADKFTELPADTQELLLTWGVIAKEPDYSTARKPAVEVKRHAAVELAA